MFALIGAVKLAAVTVFSIASIVSQCAPQYGPRTMTAIVIKESRGYQYAIGDNDARQSYYPGSEQQAIELTRYLLERGHNLDLGLMQVNSDNLASLGLSPDSIFEPCVNVRAGAQLLYGDYRGAVARVGGGLPALELALRAYNSGRYDRSYSYARDVMAIGMALPRSIGFGQENGRVSAGYQRVARSEVRHLPR